MNLPQMKILIFLFMVLAIAGCKSDVNSPEGPNAEALELYKFETVEKRSCIIKRWWNAIA